MAGFVGQHDGNAVADGVGEAGLLAHQFVALPVVGQRAFGQGADQNFQQARVNRGLGGIFRHGSGGFRIVVMAGIKGVDFQQSEQRAGAFGGVFGFQQSLFFLRVERAGHAERDHQGVVRHAVDGVPVGLHAGMGEIAAQCGDQAGAVHFQTGCQIGVGFEQVVGEGGEGAADAAVAAGRLDFLDDGVADDAGQRDEVAAVIGFREGGQAAEAAGAVQAGAVIAAGQALVRLDHAEMPAGGERVLDHRQVARFKDVQRQAAAGDEQRAGERKDGEFLRQVFQLGQKIVHSAEQNGGKFSAGRHGGRVVKTPGFEEFQQLQAGGVLVPVALAADDVEQRIGGGFAFAGGVERGGEFVAGFVVRRVFGQAGFQAGAGTLGFAALRGQSERGFGAGNFGVVGERGGNFGEDVLRLFLVA